MSNHYVLVVHGTFAASKQGEKPWYGRYEEDDNFCWELEKCLRGTELEGAVWRAMPEDGKQWEWSGDNSHTERIVAAQKLAEEIERILVTDSEACIHIVAHSHGGNVVLKCMEIFFKKESGGTSSITASIGKLVFLGTPFLKRAWENYWSRTESLIAVISIATVWTVVFGLILWLAFSLFMMVFSENYLAVFNPFQWSTEVLLGYGAVLAGIVGLLFYLVRDSFGPTRIDSNVYFDELLTTNLEPFNALVVHSGQLDEAILALTARPVIDAGIESVVDDFVDNLLGRSVMPRESLGPLAGDSYQLTHGFRVFARSLIFLLKAILNRLMRFIFDPIANYLKSRARNLILSIIEMAAFGLPSSEFRECKISVNELVSIPQLLKIDERNVSRHLMQGENLANESEKDRGKINDKTYSRNYKFLWDEKILENRIENSRVWERVETSLERLVQEYGMRSPETFLGRLKRSTIALEEHYREILGDVSLDHSAYYDHPFVIKEVADFLTGSQNEYK